MKKKPEKKYTATDLYRGTNKRLTIMIVLMSIWTVILIGGVIVAIIFAIQAYNTSQELKTQLKDSSSTIYHIIKDDVSSQLKEEVNSVVENSTNSTVESLKNSSSDINKYQSLLNSAR